MEKFNNNKFTKKIITFSLLTTLSQCLIYFLWIALGYLIFKTIEMKGSNPTNGEILDTFVLQTMKPNLIGFWVFHGIVGLNLISLILNILNLSQLERHYRYYEFNQDIERQYKTITILAMLSFIFGWIMNFIIAILIRKLNKKINKFNESKNIEIEQKEAIIINNNEKNEDKIVAPIKEEKTTVFVTKKPIQSKKNIKEKKEEGLVKIVDEKILTETDTVFENEVVEEKEIVFDEDTIENEKKVINFFENKSINNISENDLRHKESNEEVEKTFEIDFEVDKDVEEITKPVTKIPAKRGRPKKESNEVKENKPKKVVRTVNIGNTDDFVIEIKKPIN